MERNNIIYESNLFNLEKWYWTFNRTFMTYKQSKLINKEYKKVKNSYICKNESTKLRLTFIWCRRWNIFSVYIN